MAKKPDNQYSIRYRIKSQVGTWGSWHEGFGIWQGIEFAQKQIAMIKKSHLLKTIEIEFKHEGTLRDYKGEITGKSIIYESR